MGFWRANRVAGEAVLAGVPNRRKWWLLTAEELEARGGQASRPQPLGSHSGCACALRGVETHTGLLAIGVRRVGAHTVQRKLVWLIWPAELVRDAATQPQTMLAGHTRMLPTPAVTGTKTRLISSITRAPETVE